MREELKSVCKIISAFVDPIAVFDPDLRPVGCNAAYAEAAGLRLKTAEQVLCASDAPFALLGTQSSIDVERAQTAMAKKQVVRIAELVVRNAHGTELTVYQSFVPVLGDSGRCEGVFVVFRNVSDEARIQAHYKDLLLLERNRVESLELAVAERTSELTAALEEVTRVSRTDHLTGVLNRRSFNEYAEHALALAQRTHRSVGVVLCDLDHFKAINDTFGHHAGDVALTAAARALAEAVRGTDKVARFGGEEFILLLSEMASNAIEVIAERCRARVSELPMGQLIKGAKAPLTISIGTARFPADGTTLDELLNSADQALYRAKSGGRNRVVAFDPREVSKQVTARKARAQRVLVIDAEGTLPLYKDVLGLGYTVEGCSDHTQVTEICRHGNHDVLISAEDVGPRSGVDLLRQTLPLNADALRVLVIEKASLFAEVRGSNMARIDGFILREDLGAHLKTSIDEGLLRRDLNREATLRGSRQLMNAYERHLVELEKIITERRLRFAYQPIVRASDLQVFAYEALCRVDHPLFKTPTVLFDAALRSGNGWRLGRLVRQVATQPLGAIGAGAQLFVNMHPSEMDDPEFLESSLAYPNAKQIIFEITERSAIPDFPRFIEVVNKLREVGYRFAIDDLGAGYASLNSVALLGADFIKIDMAMVRDVHRSPRKASLIASIVQFAEREQIQVIAEGIESEEEGKVLREVGCHLLQGYLYGRPGLIAPGTQWPPVPMTDG